MGVSGWPAQRAGKYSVRRSGKLYKKRLKELRTFSRSCAATALAEFSSGLRPKQNAARWRKHGNSAMSEPAQAQSPTPQVLRPPRQMLQPIQRRKQMTVEPVASIRVRARRVDVGVVDRLYFHRPIILTLWSETPIAFIDDAACGGIANNVNNNHAAAPRLPVGHCGD